MDKSCQVCLFNNCPWPPCVHAQALLCLNISVPKNKCDLKGECPIFVWLSFSVSICTFFLLCRINCVQKIWSCLSVFVSMFCLLSQEGQALIFAEESGAFNNSLVSRSVSADWLPGVGDHRTDVISKVWWGNSLPTPWLSWKNHSFILECSTSSRAAWQNDIPQNETPFGPETCASTAFYITHAPWGALSCCMKRGKKFARSSKQNKEIVPNSRTWRG